MTIKPHIICIGAVYIDTILTVPFFPAEDTKLRALTHSRRRGGNTANTLQVLAQLHAHSPDATSPTEPRLHLISVLPHPTSLATHFITSSLNGVELDKSSVFRPTSQEAASSYIIQSAATRSRTIVSVNELLEPSIDEIIARISALDAVGVGWVHFEGRNPRTILACVAYLHNTAPHVGISVECEKPEREGMGDVALMADVVFYSRLWVQGRGFSEPGTFLEEQIRAREGDGVWFCMWGEGGAKVVQRRGKQVEWGSVEAWKPRVGEGEVVDTIGAGGEFISYSDSKCGRYMYNTRCVADRYRQIHLSLACSLLLTIILTGRYNVNSSSRTNSLAARSCKRGSTTWGLRCGSTKGFCKTK